MSSAKYANASRGSYYEANNAFREVFEARSDVAKFFGMKEEDRVVFTSNSTESLKYCDFRTVRKRRSCYYDFYGA